MRSELAAALVARAEDADDHNIPLMLWYGLMAVADGHSSDLVDVAIACKIPTTLRLISRRLAEEVEEDPESVNQLIAFAAMTEGDEVRSTIVAGVTEGWRGWRKVSKPAAWDDLVACDHSTPTKLLIQQLNVLFGDGRSLKDVTEVALGTTNASYPARLSALSTLIQIEPENLRSICETLLKDAKMNVLAARGLSTFDDPSVGKTLVSRYGSFRAPDRPQVISILVSRTSFAHQMLTAIGEGKIPRDDLSAFQVRQLKGLEDSELNELIGKVWGEVRDSSEQKRAAIESFKRKLDSQTLANADKSNGRMMFAKHCQTCHRLYGVGEKVGPDLTGGNRDNLDYLLDNIIDPSAVVDKTFRMTQMLTEDGRLITGLVTSETERTVSIRTATEALVFDKKSIQSQKITANSPMPDGIFDAMSDEQIRDLIGYLQHPTQVSLGH